MSNTETEQANFRMERYKYVLSQKQKLNEVTFKILTIYQAGLTLIITGTFALRIGGEEKKLDEATIADGRLALISLLAVLSAFALLSIVGGIAAWIGYRRDEAELENQVHGSSRQPPRLIDAFGWYETYIAISILCVFVAYLALTGMVF